MLEGGGELTGMQLDIAPTGAVRLQGVAGADIPFLEDRANLLVVVGVEGELPTAYALARALTATDAAEGETWQAWRLRLRLVED